MDIRFAHLTFYTFALIAIVSIAIPTAVFSQDWPENQSNQSVEFNLDKSEISPKALPDEQEIRRGQVNPSPIPVTDSSLRGILKRDIINPFNTEEAEATPAMQMLPENIIVPELPDPEIQQQINLNEFRNYLNTLVESPVQGLREELSKEEIIKQLNKIELTALMTAPAPYVVINDTRFKIGDRFSIAVDLPAINRDMERIIEQQMPNKETIPDAVYQEFESIKQEALEKFRLLEAKRQSEANATSHKIGVIISDIKHRQLILSVNGNEYIIPIKLSL